MVARIIGGIAGWLLSLTPLVIVNALALRGMLDPGSASVAGLVALAVGIGLGGLAAGLIASRRGGGFSGAGAGALAGLLFAGCLIGMMYAVRAQGTLPNLVALHPVRTMAAIVFIAVLLACVATVTAMFAGMRREPTAASEVARGAARAGGAVSRPGAGAVGGYPGAPTRDLRQRPMSAPTPPRPYGGSGPVRPPSGPRTPPQSRPGQTPRSPAGAWREREQWPENGGRW